MLGAASPNKIHTPSPVLKSNTIRMTLLWLIMAEAGHHEECPENKWAGNCKLYTAWQARDFVARGTAEAAEMSAKLPEKSLGP